MGDLISRQAVDKIIDDLLGNDNLQASPSVWHWLHMIKQLPSAERKKGRWLPVRGCDGGYWVCSSCKNPTEAFAADVLYKYCPFCGADMRGEQDDSLSD